MALDYESQKAKLRELVGNSNPTINQDINTLFQMLHDEKPLNELYTFIDQKIEPGQRDNVRNAINETWSLIQKHRNKSKMERQLVNLHSVYTVVSEMFDEHTAKNVIQRLLPMTTRVKPSNSKRVDMLINLAHKLNLRGKYKLKQTDEEIAKYIDEKGVKEGVEGLLLGQWGMEVCENVSEEIARELKNNVLPRSQKKVRTDPLANIVSKLDFYHNYGVELATDEIAKEMHQHGVRKILKELLLEHFGWKEIDKVEKLINTALTTHSDTTLESSKDVVPH